MFLVLAHTDEYIAAAAAAAVKQAQGAYDDALAAMEAVPEYRCCGIFETEAEAYDFVPNDDKYEIAYLFIHRRATDGRYVVHMGDNGWELSDECPAIAIGLFATREEACEWADNNGSVAEAVFELDVAHVEQAAA